MSFLEKARRVYQRNNGVKYIARKMETLGEVGSFMVLFFLVWKFFYREEGDNMFYGYGKFVIMGLYGLLILMVFSSYDSFKFGYLKRVDLLTGQWIGLLIVNFITYLQIALIANKVVAVWPMLLLTLAECLVSFAAVVVFSRLYHIMHEPKNMIMVYGTENARALEEKINQRADIYHVSRTVAADEMSVEDLLQEISRYDAVVLNDLHGQTRNDILKYCYGKKIRTYVVPKLTDIILRHAEDINLFDTPMVLSKGLGPTQNQLVVKRAIDVLFCILALIPGLPIMLGVALAIKLDDHGPVFYKQKRVTQNERTFNILKFRSMIVDAEKDGVSVPATDHDPRITRVGRFIRATRIDELPQVINILRGDMSIVGPRPERVEHHEAYSAEIPEFRFRTKMKGGLTGYAQVYGKYNTSAYDKIRLDLMYIENYSLLLDIKLIFLTLQTMIKPEATEGFGHQIEPAEPGREADPAEKTA